MAKKKKKPKFIAKAIGKEGALKAQAVRLGVLKSKNDTLTSAKLSALESKAKSMKNKTAAATLMKRVNLARTLRKLPRAKGPKKKK